MTPITSSVCATIARLGHHSDVWPQLGAPHTTQRNHLSHESNQLLLYHAESASGYAKQAGGPNANISLRNHRASAN